MGIVVEWRKVGEVIVLDVMGKRTSMLDGTILQQSARWLMREGHRKLVLNLKGLETIDSYGVGQLIATYTTVRTQGGDLKLTGPTPEVRRVLRHTRVDTVLIVFDTEAAAIRALEAL